MSYPRFNTKWEALQWSRLAEDALQHCTYTPNAIQRVPTLDHPRSRNGFLIMFDDGGFYCNNWEDFDGSPAIYQPKGVKPLSEQERSKRNSAIAQAEQQRRANAEKMQQERAAQATAFYAGAQPIDAKASFPYLVRKNVRPTETMRESSAEAFNAHFGAYPNTARGAIKSGRILVNPLVYGDRISSLQIISEDGRKSFLSGGRITGACWRSRRPRQDEQYIAIGEGVATVLSVIQNDNADMLGIAALSCHNLPVVAKELREKYPQAGLILCGDNDPKGAGQRAAKEAARIAGGLVSVQIPEFSNELVDAFQRTEGKKLPTDWNDYYKAINNLEKLNDR